MGDFGAAERRILEFMSKGTEFVFNGKGYTVMLSGKPTCHKGEPKRIFIYWQNLVKMKLK